MKVNMESACEDNMDYGNKSKKGISLRVGGRVSQDEVFGRDPGLTSGFELGSNITSHPLQHRAPPQHCWLFADVLYLQKPFKTSP